MRNSEPSVLDGKGNGELTDAQLEAPRIPRAPSTPDLVPGRDYSPLPGDPQWVEPRPLRQASPRRGTFALGREAFSALVATGIGFGLGVVVAWALGVI
jgi:hypothetical protein